MSQARKIAKGLVQTSKGFIVTGAPDALIGHCVQRKELLPLVVIAGNEKVVGNTAFQDGVLTQYPSHEAYKAGEGIVLAHFDGMKQIVASQTAFTALTSVGTLYAWGDARYGSCLAREVSEKCPATAPGLVEDLQDLPTGEIVKVSSGGYVTAALTAGNDLYIWGGRPGQPKLLDQMEGYPTPIDLEGQDFLDVAVGSNHMIVLTTDHRVFVVGSSGNGQLGLGSVVKKSTNWKEVVLPLADEQRVVSVHAGYKSSLLLVE